MEHENELCLKETQQISLEILHEVASLCDELGLRYSLIYGTLLGAIRHNGFIPWDDDVDIMMPRPDYEALLEYLNAHPNKMPNYSVFNPDSCHDYPYMITRISDDRYEIETENEVSYGLGVFIDIYPYDGLGSSKGEAFTLGLKGDFLSSLCFQATRKRLAVGATVSKIRVILKAPAFLYSHLRGKSYFQGRLKALAGTKLYDESVYVGCVTWLSGGWKDIFRKDWFDELIVVPFENYKFKIPKKYDDVLRHTYGDYMCLPNEEDRIGHHFYKVYARN